MEAFCSERSRACPQNVARMSSGLHHTKSILYISLLLAFKLSKVSIVLVAAAKHFPSQFPQSLTGTMRESLHDIGEVTVSSPIGYSRVEFFDVFGSQGNVLGVFDNSLFRD